MQRLNITLPDDLVRDFKRSVPSGKRSEFIADIVRKKLPKRNVRKEWIKSLKASKKLYAEVKADWASIEVEGWPD